MNKELDLPKCKAGIYSGMNIGAALDLLLRYARAEIILKDHVWAGPMAKEAYRKAKVEFHLSFDRGQMAK